jgi:hypothetical protein
MARRFNTTGPCIPARHYLLEPEARCPGLMDLIDGESFFVIHAPRQSGKTTLLNTLEQRLNAAGLSKPGGDRNAPDALRATEGARAFGVRRGCAALDLWPVAGGWRLATRWPRAFVV